MDQLKKVFKTAVEFNLKKKGGETLCYVNFENAKDAAEAYDSQNGSKMGMIQVSLTQFLHGLE